jgi:hypothetical protein
MKRGSMALAAALALLVSCSPQNSATSAKVSGTAGFADRSGTASEFNLQVQGVAAAPGGQAYQGWLVGTDGKTYLSLGTLSRENDGSVSLTWDSPNGENLLLHYSGFEATVESSGGAAQPTGKALFGGSLADQAKGLFGSDAKRPSPVAPGLKQQTNLAAEHAAMAQGAQQISAWDEMKAHLEHVVNILEGKAGSKFGDYLGTGVPQNPGDGYGVIAYARDLQSAFGSDDGVAAAEKDFQTKLDAVEKTCLTALKLKNEATAGSLLQDLQTQIKALQTGPVDQLYQKASAGLTFVVGNQS